MGYTKDIILDVNYGQAEAKVNWMKSILRTLSKHKMITSVISITIMLIILDCMLISSFVSVLSNLG